MKIRADIFAEHLHNSVHRPGCGRPAFDNLIVVNQAKLHLWVAERDAIIATLTAALPALNANSYKPHTVERAAREWDAWFREGLTLAPATEKSKLDLLSNEMLQKRLERLLSPEPEGEEPVGEVEQPRDEGAEIFSPGICR